MDPVLLVGLIVQSSLTLVVVLLDEGVHGWFGERSDDF